MNLFETLNKQGGFKLIKRYLQSGVLFTAIAELLILGKESKALEILRLAAEYKTKRKIEKKYKKKLLELEEKYDYNLPHNKSNKVWVCWFQGLEEAPELVKRCYESLKDNLSTKEIILITENNMCEYVSFPKYIIKKWKEGRITNTHMTDLLRLELLLKYGGTWVDATVYCSSKIEEIPDYFFDSELFLFQTLKPGRDGLAAFVSSWYISSYTNNKILWLTRELCYEYWKTHNSLVDYFLLHIFLCMVLESNEEEWDNIVPRDNAAPHILLLRFFDKYDKGMYDNIIVQTPFHKLSYKFTEEDKKQQGTYYKYIINKKE